MRKLGEEARWRRRISELGSGGYRSSREEQLGSGGSLSSRGEEPGSGARSAESATCWEESSLQRPRAGKELRGVGGSRTQRRAGRGARGQWTISVAAAPGRRSPAAAPVPLKRAEGRALARGVSLCLLIGVFVSIILTVESILVSANWHL